MKERGADIIKVARDIYAVLPGKVDSTKLACLSFGKDSLGEKGFADDFNDESAMSYWQPKGDAATGSALIKDGKITVHFSNKNYFLTREVSISLSKFPVFAMCYDFDITSDPEIYIYWKDIHAKNVLPAFMVQAAKIRISSVHRKSI